MEELRGREAHMLGGTQCLGGLEGGTKRLRGSKLGVPYGKAQRERGTKA